MLILLNPKPAAAYLDPSAGNALVYIAVTMVSVGAYAVKGAFYRLMGKKAERKAEGQNDIALFSEGKSYWNTFEPVVRALLERGQAFSYYTMDIEDPGLTIRSPLMTSRYIGEGSAGCARLNRTACRVMLATTPNIGTPGYPLPRPPKVGFLTHVFHDPDGVGYYKKGALDFYDGVCTVGDYAQPAIRYLEELRRLPKKELVSLGLPYWDLLLKKAEAYRLEGGRGAEARKGRARKVILLAPSWGEKGFLSCYDLDFIGALAEEFDLIFRPHPQSRKSEPELLKKVQKMLAAFPGAEWDESPEPSYALAASDLLVSDTSAIRMDYAVIYKKPVISLEVKAENVSSFELDDLPIEMRSFADKLCTSVKADGIANLNAIVRAALEAENVSKLGASACAHKGMRENIANLGSAGEHIADYLIHKAKALSPEALNTPQSLDATKETK